VSLKNWDNKTWLSSTSYIKSFNKFLIKEIENQTKKLALALKVKGFMNVQFAIKKDEIYVIEVNPRASRTVPFVQKQKVFL